MSSRVAELDASSLDNELLSVITSYLDLYVRDIRDTPSWVAVYKYIKRSVPLLYNAHLVVKGTSPGQQLLGCSFSDFTIPKRVFLYLIEYLAPVVLNAIKEDTHSRASTKLVEKALTFAGCLQLINFVVFLSSGGSSSLVRRVLGLNTCTSGNQLQGRLNNAAVNRELLGHCIANVILVTRPFMEMLKSTILRQTPAPEDILFDTSSVICAHCNQVAVVALEAQKDNGTPLIFCNYCYYVVKQKQKFISVTTFSLANN
ncbi:unnamed protein product [Bursaphelenchus okinawaensis]|uniref:Uncharacterized protein n=1 Tax=Bursaphelenchus okinawaensis TaxID=465554 RepID=A0A811JTE6_9BILA|nr:unnamed protein product [Bursaphelenchus okinawaensis]CAG9082173.1 unnamed protein product [Bursaphelenchus okinawaensis]